MNKMRAHPNNTALRAKDQSPAAGLHPPKTPPIDFIDKIVDAQKNRANELLNPARRKGRVWTAEQRAAQAQKVKNWKPWQKSTGPQTALGKAKASYNAYKHGGRSAAGKKFDRAIAAHNRFLRDCLRVHGFSIRNLPPIPVIPLKNGIHSDYPMDSGFRRNDDNIFNKEVLPALRASSRPSRETTLQNPITDHRKPMTEALVSVKIEKTITEKNMNFKDLAPSVLSQNTSYDHHETVRRVTLSNGLVAIIAVHNTKLGPALGGLRMRAYKSEDEALTDVLRLSRGMTYKNAMAGLPLGGGKAVIIGDFKKDKSEQMMEEIGEAVESFAGKYITAEDSGSSEEDMLAISRKTTHVTGLPPEYFHGKDFGELGGNPSPLTALGCYHGIRAAVHQRFGGNSLSGLKVAVQGVGAVGMELCKLLRQDGVEIFMTDTDQMRLKSAQEELNGAHIVGLDEIYEVEAEVFAPCAMGGILNDDTIPKLRAHIVAGASNNQLLSAHHDKQMFDRKILYVPDYVLNAGGVICVGYEYFRKSGYNPLGLDITRASMVNHVERIGHTVTDILIHATAHHICTGAAADKLAEAKFMGTKPLQDDDLTPEDSASFGQGGGTTMVQ